MTPSKEPRPARHVSSSVLCSTLCTCMGGVLHESLAHTPQRRRLAACPPRKSPTHSELCGARSRHGRRCRRREGRQARSPSRDRRPLHGKHRRGHPRHVFLCCGCDNRAVRDERGARACSGHQSSSAGAEPRAVLPAGWCATAESRWPLHANHPMTVVPCLHDADCAAAWSLADSQKLQKLRPSNAGGRRRRGWR